MVTGQVAAYVRVSSRSQTVETQTNAITRCAVARGDSVATWFSERASARTNDRPELARLRDEAQRGNFRKLYVYRLDRLCRTGIRDTLTLLQLLSHCGVEVCTVADGFDPSGPFGEVVVAVLAWAAQVERLAIGERIASARLRLADQGRSWGRPTKLDRSDVRALVAMASDGVSVRQLARDFGVPRSTVQDALRRSKLTQAGNPQKKFELKPPKKARGRE